MSRAPSTQRVPLLLLALVCTILIGWASMQAGGLIIQARASQLTNAERAISQAVAPLIQQDRIPARLARAVQGLIDTRTADLDFVTVRNANDRTLVSRGRLGENGLAWLPLAEGRVWRSWLYRARSAQLLRPIQQAGQRVGSVRFGVTWTSIVYRAGMPLFVWATALVAGIMGLFGLVMRRSVLAAEPARTHAGRPVPQRPAVSGAQPAARAGKRAPLSRFLGRKRDVLSGFEPIGTGGRSAPPPASGSVARPAPDESSRVPAGSPNAPAVDSLPPEKAHARPSLSPPESGDARSDGAAREDAHVTSPKAQAPVEPSPPPSTRHAGLPVGERSAAAFEAPTLGDTTLDLRFYPIWRGEGPQQVLAGACAALAWRTGEFELVDADTLTRLAEQDGALRAFTQWIARRFSLLHANWRTLELNTVPIVLPIPRAMLAFADAQAVWRNALRRTDRDPNDLILRLDRASVTAAQTALPLRLALNAPHDHAAALPGDCDLLCISPQHINGNADPWRERFDELECPVLFGPVTQTEAYTQILGHERVMWFSDQPQDRYSPRSFARLLARHPTQPI